MIDEDAALAAIATLNDLSEAQQNAQSKIASILHEDGSSPFIDVQELLSLYNILYFRSLLPSRVEVSWSTRLTLSAGMCELVKDGEGKYRQIRLKLSEPLLKYRTRSDTINTLLHEAIHAYFLVTTGWKHSRGDDGTGHGSGFLLLADAISNHGGYNVTVYHTFHDEVDAYRTHVWKCDGPCQHQPPFFGLVKRSMNRPPSKSDPWWTKHQEECGGTYTKISAPEPTKAQLNAMTAKERAGRQKNKIDVWIQRRDSKNGQNVDTAPLVHASNLTESSLMGGSEVQHPPNDTKGSRPPAGNSMKRKPPAEDEIREQSKKLQIACPICDERMDEVSINQHLDENHAL
jgi:hypothetical protein